MEFLAKSISNLFIRWSNLPFSNDEIEVFYYGTECFLNSFFTFVVLCVWGIISDTLIPTTSWLTVFCIYRHHAGGPHANTNMRCIAASSLLGMSNYIALSVSAIVLRYRVLITIIILTVCIFIVPFKSTKKILSKKDSLIEKLLSIAIVLFVIILSLVFEPKIAVSILYALLVANLLIVIASAGSLFHKIANKH